MARSVIKVTSRPDYLDDVNRVFEAGVPVHLFAGERSREGWNVPDFVLRQSASFTTQPAVGHMMPLENPDKFLGLVVLFTRL